MSPSLEKVEQHFHFLVLVSFVNFWTTRVALKEICLRREVSTSSYCFVTN